MTNLKDFLKDYTLVAEVFEQDVSNALNNLRNSVPINSFDFIAVREDLMSNMKIKNLSHYSLIKYRIYKSKKVVR